jgi:hypothetical protein
MASITYSSAGLPATPQPAGTIFNNPVDGQVYISNGYSWFPHNALAQSGFSKWTRDDDMTVRETEVRILKATPDRFISWQEAKDFSGSELYLDFKRNKISLLLEITSHGFNPVNALDRKVNEIKKFCNDNTLGLWSMEVANTDFESNWQQHQFKVNIDMHFEKSEDRLLFMKDYIVLEKLSN